MNIKKPKNVNEFIGNDASSEKNISIITKKVKGLNVKFEEDLHQDFKLLCIKNKTTMQDVIHKLVKEWTKRQLKN
ncbi:plasmid partition protein ParG [Dialister micraerophilus]|uniref:plasmid partition protein ParG n=1 Tax=Dialister micraerophilus TaxID=309120 RepID=UPI0023F1CB37|nr:plasmid partition protein ParG [Dialister micraerophilus]